MAEVAKHQDQADELRAKYTYTQKVRVRAIRSDGKLSREEYTVYNVLPSVDGTKKELVKFAGRYTDKGQVVEYKKSGEEIPGRKIDIDSGLLPSLRDHLVNDKKSRDGLGKHLFPLTTAEMKKYDYRLDGEQTVKGIPCYKIKFWPKKEFAGFDDGKTIWAGEVLIEKASSQAISVNTHMAKHLPLLVRTVFGTNLHELGYSLTYARFGETLYFPVSYGGEFDVRGGFVYKRTFTISLENSDFRRGEAESTITFAPTP